ncbi:Por secretion system C-terminal sorting domain-containing protein [Pricia antarctica]|uniref:Por secretion system C-terminal sorting domain-containing protein n=1 Tax=Pricia antarctica TaxID=641691 RepID=A0A1G6W3A7_9FLAO|nr:T9SS type A sorting domain-containing protein [Pricia antarctica]SDD59526.1 Por secretion system C-terminal sorting domain-containing protein [Pricia antarctica]
MKILYFALFMFLTVALSAQTSLDFQNGTTKEISEVKLYPNPAFEGVVHLLTKANADKRITVYDVFGEVVLTDKITGKTLDISRLVPGVYVLQLDEGQNTVTRKLVVK